MNSPSDRNPDRDAEVFAQALALPPAARAACLARACGNDTDMRRRIEVLLEANVRVGGFLEKGEDDSEIGKLVTAAQDGASSRVGRYRLIEKIGEGGCGVVYLAEQEEPVRRQVALKIIKPGMDTKEVIGRFEAERQALAMMDHPGIAKVLDAGQTESGRPYFVMELIRGIKITDYCDQHSLPTDERLKLFVQVCHAIQHAHQKGVIHRDIKPSNILVITSAEGALQPVVIDFGIAKATVNVHLTDKTLFTAVDMLIGTPTYMSPEQTTASRADLDTRSDIYSLGVLLYELLTGTTPFDAGELLQLGIDEVRRAIREQEPLRPSARLSKLTIEQLTTVAQRRGAEPPTLIHAVRGDLDWIAMKALEKDRTRRYETANGLALDVGRFLANDTILARPASTLYRLQKAVRRNKLAFGGLVAIATLIVGSLIAISVALTKERHSRQAADAARRLAEAASARMETEKANALTEAERSRQATDFLREMLLGVDPSVARGRDTTLLLEILQKNSARLEEQLRSQPKIRFELHSVIGSVYKNINHLPQAIQSHRLGVIAAREGFGPESAQMATALSRLGGTLHFARQFEESEKVLRESLALKRRIYGAEHVELPTTMALLGALLTDSDRKKNSEGETLLREALAMRRKLLANDHVEVTTSLYSLGAYLLFQGEQLAEAEQLLGDTVERRIKQSGEDGPYVGVTVTMLASAQLRQAKLSAAEANARRSVASVTRIYGAVHPSSANALACFATVLQAQGKMDEAEEILKKVLKLRPQFESNRMRTLIPYLLEKLYYILLARRDMSGAETLAHEEFTLNQSFFGRESREAAVALNHWATVLAATDRGEEADRRFMEFATTEFLTKPASGHYLRERANYQARRGRWLEATADARASIAHLPGEAMGFHVLAALLVHARDVEGSGSLCRSLLVRFEKPGSAIQAMQLAMDSLVLPPESSDLAEIAKWVDVAVRGGAEGNWERYAQCTKALLEYRRGNFPDAIEWAAQARKSLRPDLRATAGAVWAMAQHRLGNVDAARAALSDYANFKDAGMPPDLLAVEWNDWICADLGPEWKMTEFARALLGEARTTLQMSAELVGRPNPQ